MKIRDKYSSNDIGGNIKLMRFQAELRGLRIGKQQEQQRILKIIDEWDRKHLRTINHIDELKSKIKGEK